MKVNMEEPAQLRDQRRLAGVIDGVDRVAASMSVGRTNTLLSLNSLKRHNLRGSVRPRGALYLLVLFNQPIGATSKRKANGELAETRLGKVVLRWLRRDGPMSALDRLLYDARPRISVRVAQPVPAEQRRCRGSASIVYRR